MKKLVSTLNLGKKEWLKYRKGGIGGSDAGAICGLNPYRTAIQVYNDKRTDEIEEFDNEAMREGRDLEEYVARRFMETTGKKVRRANTMFYDEENPFMLADVDRMIVGENAGLECKTASPFSADKWEDDKIPLSYQIQCYHYMSVMNADRWYVAVLIYGTEFKVYCLERDEEMIQNLVHIEADFWNNHVQAGVIPAPDGSKLADKVIAEYFSDPVDETIELSGYQKQLERRDELKELIDKMTKEVSLIEQEIKMMMGNAEKAKADNYRISWKASQRTDLDRKRIKAEEPEIYDRFKRTSISRRFIVSAA
ncbi:YqaJ viral recombinase family protein [Dorea longicatena]|uniref:YqaJ viral recombinase family nuclease n=1 Tax=Dorea longicatena TaxID=88431 RepID=UPI0032C1156E